SYTKTELKGLKKRLISDLKRVQILRQFVGSVPVNKNNYYYYSPEPTLQTGTVPSLTGLKRKVSVSVSAAERDGKRQCGGRGNGRVSNASKRKVIMRECGKILGKLMKDKNGWVFNKPVDVAGLKLYDYYNVIKQPMDLGTIKGKIGKNEYKSPREFAEDVRLTFENAMVYNGKGSSVFGMAERLLVMFEGLFCSAYPKFAKNGSVLVGKRVEKAVLNPTVVVESGIEAEAPVVGKKLGGDIGKPIIRTIRTGSRREMTDEEKAELAASFLNLNLGQEGMHQIMAIVKKGAGLEREGDEIELDLGVLDNETLWELHSFIGRTLGNKGGTGCNVNRVVNELNGSVQTDSCRERDAGEEYVDIGEEEMQLTNYPSVVIEKDVVNGSDSGSGSGSDSSSDSDASSSDSGSGTSYNEHEVNSTPKGVVP
ncbi:hypothetical protein M8C21_005377, partial [Ambrosia artemisiifolia]